jgi:probable rRNA maturation factor
MKKPVVNEKRDLKPLKDFESLQVNIKISTDKEITQLNKKYFNRDYTTDVLSFNIDQKLEDGSFYLGDIIVNKDQAHRQCKEYGNDLENEVADLVSHGMLHLLGVHHPDDDEHTIHGVKA